MGRWNRLEPAAEYAQRATGSEETVVELAEGERPRPAVALTIAGFDPSSGAGITADLKVFAAHRIYGVAAATALTVQSTAGVRRVEPVRATLLAETLACLAEDLPLAGIKIGMLATAANVEAVARFLEGIERTADAGYAAGQAPAPVPVVLDPVLRSSSGHPLLDADGLHALRTRLLPLASCMTPNLDELLLLARPRLGTPAHKGEKELVAKAAALLGEEYPRLAMIATGGHLAEPDDYIVAPGQPPLWLPGERVDTPATHGTGCGYSSALLCELIAGRSIVDAATAAKRYVTEALQAATPMGRGGGSMHHLYASYPQHLPPQRTRT